VQLATHVAKSKPGGAKVAACLGARFADVVDGHDGHDVCVGLYERVAVVVGCVISEDVCVDLVAELCVVLGGILRRRKYSHCVQCVDCSMG
jgi:hypothetical protein